MFSGFGDKETNNMEDATATTIEFLRARLLSERSVSRTARLRADELAQRVMELEEQLKIVSLQRKKAEKATADVLAILESHGRSDVSETFDSSSDQEAEVGICSLKGKEPSSNGKHGEMGTFSGSEHESSIPIGRGLSWKSSRDSLDSLEKKFIDSSRRRRSSLASSGSSSPKRVGKSCRQIRRREHRLAVEELHNDSSRNDPHEDEVISSSEGVHKCSDIGPETSREGSENRNERDLGDAPISSVSESHNVSDDHYMNNRGGKRDMEMALQHQAQLIDRFEAEEKAQREWEEKFRENNGSTPDSCDPGNQSDVTEEREEIKAPAPSMSNGIKTSPNQENKSGSGDACLNNVLNPSAQPLKDKGDEDNVDCHQHSPLDVPNHSPDLRETRGNNLVHVSSSEVSSLLIREAPDTTNGFALKPREDSDRLGSVLEALQQAKLSIQQNLDRVPLLEGGTIQRAIEPSLPAAGFRDRYAMPVGSAGLFRLPTDYQYGATTQADFLGSSPRLSMSNYSPEPTGANFLSSPYRDTRSGSFIDDRFLTVPSFPYPKIRSRVPTRHPTFESGLDAALPSFSNRYNLDPQSSAGLPTQPLLFDPSLGACLPTVGRYTSPDLHSGVGTTTRQPVYEPNLNAGLLSYERYTTNLDPRSSAGVRSSSNFTHTGHTTHLSYPNLMQRMPSSSTDGGFSGFFPNRDAGLPPSSFSYHDNHTRPNMYR